ncbi:MAG: sigma-70 family RNA polymerase sigma factor [Planctomycetota bacterium]
MSDQPSTHPIEAMLAHERWVRALARSLVLDEADSDDVVQQAWIAALRSPPGAGRGVRGWLATVVRNAARTLRRDEDRRRSREQAAARPESLPSTAELVEEAHLRRHLVAEVLRLDEPYRSTVLLRYFRDMPPHRIASQQRIPVATVKTRLRRALGRLRQRLDEDYRGDRAAWCFPLLHLTTAEAHTAATLGLVGAALKSALLGGLAVCAKVKLGLISTVLVGLFAIVWLSVRQQNADLDAVSGAVQQRANGAVDGVPAVQREVAREVLEKGVPELSAPVAEGYGSLLVHVNWSGDGSPACGIGVAVERPGGPYGLNQTTAKTDSDGVVSFERVAPGKIWVVLDRGGRHRSSVTAGEQTEITLTIPPGMIVEGIVQDSRGIPVPGAEIWLSQVRDLLVGSVVCYTAIDGTFCLRDVSKESELGARARGFCSSELHSLRSSAGTRVFVRLILAPGGGEVTGQVSDAERKPVSGAGVLLSSLDNWLSVTFEDGSEGVKLAKLLTHADDEGRFRFIGIQSGATSLSVRKLGWAPWNGTVEIAEGSTTHVDIHLVRGVTVSGRVTDSANRPVAGVEISVGEPMREIFPLETHSTQDGSYQLQDLVPGEFVVTTRTYLYGPVSASFHASPGEVLEWNPVLVSSSLEIVGRVVDETGLPLQGYHVLAYRTDLPTFQVPGAQSDSQGRFVIKNCADVAYDLVVRPLVFGELPLALEEAVLPGRSEVVLRVLAENRPSAYVEGVVVDAAGNPLGGAQVRLELPRWAVPDVLTEHNTGRFVAGPVPPGRYGVRIKASGWPTLRVAARDLLQNETWNLGVLRLTPGSRLVATLRRADGRQPANPRLWIVDSDGYKHGVTCEGEKATSVALAPGTYTLCASGNDIAFCPVPFEIVHERETRLELVLHPGVERILTFLDHRPAASRHGETTRVYVRDRSGILIRERNLYPLQIWGDEQPGDLTMSITVGVGSYVVEVRDTEVLVKRAFEVTELSPQEVPIVVPIGSPQ